MDEFKANAFMAIGLVVSVFGGMFLDSQGKAYSIVLTMTFIGLVIAGIGVIAEYRRLFRVRQNRERRAIQRMLDRERRA